jgi:predicted CopG family antitoxin
LSEKFIYYNCYNGYKDYKMANTTIAITNELKKKIMEFGMKGESYNEILERLVESAKRRQIEEILMNDEGFVSIEEAIKEADRLWPK